MTIWDGSALHETVKTELYHFFSDMISKASEMNNTDYAALLKKNYNHSGHGDKKMNVFCTKNGVEFSFDREFDELDGDNSFVIPWNMAARHIRAWEYEKSHGENLLEKPVQSAMQNEPTENDIALFEQYKEHFGISCRFEKVFGFDDKYAKQHRDKADELYNEIVSKGLEPAYKKWREMQCNSDEQSMCDICANNDGNCLKPAEGECIRYVSESESVTYLSANKIEEDKMARKLQFDAAITKDMKAAASDSFTDSIKMIEINEIMNSHNNFYEISDIELLADDIEREGLKHNLVVTKDSDTGLYVVKSGHRRLAAIKLLINEKRRSSTKIPCFVDGEKSTAETQFDLIMLNATQRKYTDADKLHEYEELEKTFKALADEGKPLKGRMRDNIAAAMHVSAGQVQKIDNIKRNAIPEVEQAVKNGDMSISTANEVAKLTEEKQQEIIKEKPAISHKEVKEIQENEKPKKAAPPTSSKSETAEDNRTDELDKVDDFDDFSNDVSTNNDDTYITDEDNSSDNLSGDTYITSGSCDKSKKELPSENFILSAAEAKAFYDYLDDWGIVEAVEVDEDTPDTIVKIWGKFKSFLGE